MGRQRRLQQRACPPARRRRPQAAGAGGRQRGQVGDQTEALGRSRGGLTTKIHLGCDGRGRPLGVVLTPGQRHDSTQLEPVLDAIRVPRPCGRVGLANGPTTWSATRVTAIRGVGSCCAAVASRTPSRSGPTSARRAGRPGRPLGFDRARYRGRNVVERCFNRLKQFRAVATRYDKRAVNYRAMVVIASLLIWLEG